MIMFDGMFRKKEIDILFSIHPSTKVIDSMNYQKLLDGEPYVSDPAENQTDADSEKFTDSI